MGLLGISSFFLTVLLVLALTPLAKKIGLTDIPGSRKKHAGEIPLIGGISLYLSMIILFYWSPMHNYWYIVAATLIIICGIIDDYKHLHYKTRLSVEVIATGIMIHWGGAQITDLGDLFGLGNIQLGY